jgi:hypothetical protein
MISRAALPSSDDGETDVDDDHSARQSTVSETRTTLIDSWSKRWRSTSNSIAAPATKRRYTGSSAQRRIWWKSTAVLSHRRRIGSAAGIVSA